MPSQAAPGEPMPGQPASSEPAPGQPATTAIETPASLPVRAVLHPATLQTYAADWQAFRAWCRTAGCVPLPADPATVTRYLGTLADTRGRAALARRLAAIAHAHRAQGLAPPAGGPAARNSLRALLHAAPRQAPRGRRRAPLPSAAQLQRMAANCPGDLAGRRDRALLLLAAAGLDRKTLLAIDREHVRFTPAGCELDLPGARTGGAQPIAITIQIATIQIARLRPPDACPAHALEDWIRISECGFGPVFRKVDRWGNVEHRRLGTDAIRRILRRRRPRRAAPAAS